MNFYLFIANIYMFLTLFLENRSWKNLCSCLTENKYTKNKFMLNAQRVKNKKFY